MNLKLYKYSNHILHAILFFNSLSPTIHFLTLNLIHQYILWAFPSTCIHRLLLTYQHRSWCFLGKCVDHESTSHPDHLHSSPICKVGSNTVSSSRGFGSTRYANICETLKIALGSLTLSWSLLSSSSLSSHCPNFYFLAQIS